MLGKSRTFFLFSARSTSLYFPCIEGKQNLTCLGFNLVKPFAQGKDRVWKEQFSNG